MALTNVWLAGYGGPVIGATAVWLAPNDGTVPSATLVTLAGWNGPVAGATPVWIAGYGGPPPAAIGAIPICISGWGGGSGGGGGTTTSVWSAADAAANGMTLTNGGLTVTPSGDAVWRSIRSSISSTSGKLYIEMLNSVTVTGYMKIGLADATFPAAANYLGLNYSFGVDPPNGGPGLASAGFVLVGSIAVTPVNVGDVLSIAIDFAAQKIWLARNNVWASSGNPSTGASPYATFTAATTGALFAAMSFYQGAGVWTLQSTAASQKYAPPSGFSAWDGGVAQTPAQAYLARTVGGNEGGNGANITTLIDGLVADGVWAKLDALYVLAQQNETDAKLNLIGTSYSLTQTGSLAQIAPRIGSLNFTAYRGFAGFNTLGSNFNTGFNAATAASPNFLQNSASFGVWTNGAVSENYTQIGNSASGAAGESHIYDNFPGNAFYARLNNATVGSVPTPGTTGLFVGDRPSSSNVIPYWNGTAQASQASASQAVYNGNFTIGVVGALNGTAQQLAAAFIGASLGAAGQLALYNRLKTYMDAVAPPATSVWSSSDATANGMTLSNGGLTVTPQGGTAWGTIRGSTGKTSGKLYFELSNSAVTSGSLNELYGVASSGFNPVDYLGNNNYSTGVWPDSPNSFASTGFTKNFTYASSLKAAQNDVYAFAVDFTAGAIWMARNNVWDNSITPTLSKILPLISFTPATVGALFPAISFNATGGGNLGVWTLQSAAASQKYAPPSGFTPWG